MGHIARDCWSKGAQNGQIRMLDGNEETDTPIGYFGQWRVLATVEEEEWSEIKEVQEELHKLYEKINEVYECVLELSKEVENKSEVETLADLKKVAKKQETQYK